MRILILNGALGGKDGNTARLFKAFGTDVRVVHLASDPFPSRADLADADAFVFATGTYWDSWGSPLQRFLEQATPLEGDACWFGKPAAILVTMHSVGGKEVASRLQGVLNTFGLFVPPMGAMTFSLVNQEALRSGSAWAEDFWCLDDVDVLAQNLRTAAQNKIGLNPGWTQWPVDREDPSRIWLGPVSS